MNSNGFGWVWMELDGSGKKCFQKEVKVFTMGWTIVGSIPTLCVIILNMFRCPQLKSENKPKTCAQLGTAKQGGPKTKKLASGIRPVLRDRMLDVF